MLIACVLSIFLPAGISRMTPGAVERSRPRTQAAPEVPPLLELRIGLDVAAEGWVVLPEWSGVWVAGGGTLSEIDQDSGEVRQTGEGAWDYDYVQLAEYGEGGILLASGSVLWALDASSGGVIDRLDLDHLGSVGAVVQTRSGAWVAASGGGGGSSRGSTSRREPRPTGSGSGTGGTSS